MNAVAYDHLIIAGTARSRNSNCLVVLSCAGLKTESVGVCRTMDDGAKLCWGQNVVDVHPVESSSYVH